MLRITDKLAIPFDEITMEAVRSQGAGGQNVNKVASAIHLRFDIQASSLPEVYKQRLLRRRDKRLTKDGVLVIKAQEHRTQERNRIEALQRLRTLIKEVMVVPKTRKATKPTKASQRRRLDAKKQRGQVKAQRRRPLD